MYRREIGESTIRFATLLLATRFLRSNGPLIVENDTVHIDRVNSLEAVAGLHENCPVCLELMEVNCVRLPLCRHCFHRGCLILWFENNSTCPLCRSAVYTFDSDGFPISTVTFEL